MLFLIILREHGDINDIDFHSFLNSLDETKAQLQAMEMDDWFTSLVAKRIEEALIIDIN